MRPARSPRVDARPRSQTLGRAAALAAVAAAAATAAAGPAFADHPVADVAMAEGSSVPGCEAAARCFVPASVSVAAGGEVRWTNLDAEAHTATGGTPGEPSGAFDSGLVEPGSSFSRAFAASGTHA